MNRALLVLFVCSLLTLTLSDHADARKKHKKGEPVICKKGKLIFEDDFWGKELEWQVINGEWGISKKALVTESVGGGGECPSVRRMFTPSENVIVELRLRVPLGAHAVHVELRDKLGAGAPRILRLDISKVGPM